MVAAPTATAPGCGKPSWPPWPPTPACTYRVPPTTRHLEMEQDRTPVVLPHLHELARTAPDQPRRHRGEHRGHHHPHRAERARRPRHHHLPPRGEDPRRADERATRHRHPAPPRLAPRMELHPQPTPELSVSIIGKG